MRTMQKAYAKMLIAFGQIPPDDHRARVVAEAAIFKYEDMFPEVREMTARYDRETIIKNYRSSLIPEDPSARYTGEVSFAPRRYLEHHAHGYMTAIHRRTFHRMGTTRTDSGKSDPVWAEVTLGYGIGAQSLKHFALTTDHTMISDPLCLSITFWHSEGGGAMGKGVLEILETQMPWASHIARIAEAYHLNGMRSRCDCMTLRYNVEDVKYDEDAPSMRQRCLITELRNGSRWWHEPLPQSVIDDVCSWQYDTDVPSSLYSDRVTIIDGRVSTATWEETQ